MSVGPGKVSSGGLFNAIRLHLEDWNRIGNHNFKFRCRVLPRDGACLK